MFARQLRPWLSRSAAPGGALSGLAHDRRGAAMIEFALCGGAFIALMLAAIQIALIYFAEQGLQTSAEIMARKVATGEIKQSGTSQTQFRDIACTTLPSYMNCSKLIIDARSVLNFSDIDTSMPSMTYDSSGNVTSATRYSLGSTGSVVILRLMYNWGISAGPLGLSLANQGSGKPRLLIGTMVFKSEPYSS